MFKSWMEMSCGLVAIHACYLRVILVWVVTQRANTLKVVFTFIQIQPTKSKHSKESKRFRRTPSGFHPLSRWVLHLCVLEVAIVCLFFLAVGQIGQIIRLTVCTVVWSSCGKLYLCLLHQIKGNASETLSLK